METASDGTKIAWADRKISEVASKRIGRIAFKMALTRKNPMVTIVHKSNVLSVSDGLFRETVLDVAAEFKGKVVCEEQLVDSMVYRMIREPERFDVVVAPNLYGDIIR